MFLRIGVKRRLVFLGVLLWIGVFLCAILVLLCQDMVASQSQGFPYLIASPIKALDSPKPSHYTLASLEDAISEIQDMDVIRVVNAFKAQQEMIPQGTPPVRIVLCSTWRSGSTLVGEMLGSHPGVFYHYEPLISYGLQQIQTGSEQQGAVLDLLSGLLQCNYTGQDPYLKFAYGNLDVFVRNTRLWDMCSSMPRFKCYMPDTLTKLCSLFPVHVMKVVRARLSLLQELLKEKINVVIVWLVRDPRAIIASRKHSVDWCLSRSCQDPSALCYQLLQDFQVFSLLRKTYPKQVMLLRYEDLAKKPYNKTEAILKFAGLSMHSKVVNYLDDHLSTDEDVPWSTRHLPAARVGRWRTLESWQDILKTQYYCRSVMDALGYRLFTIEEDVKVANALKILNLP